MMHDHKCQCPDCDEARGETAEPPQPSVFGANVIVTGVAEPAPPAAPLDATAEPGELDGTCLTCGKLCDITQGGLIHVQGWFHEGCDPIAALARLEAENAQLRQLIQDQAWPEPLKPGERQKLEDEVAALREWKAAVLKVAKESDGETVTVRYKPDGESNTQKSVRDPVESSHGE